MVSAADRDMTDRELLKMGEIIGGLPVFQDYNRSLFPWLAMALSLLFAARTISDDVEAGIRHLLLESDFDGRIINVDKLTYAGNLCNLFRCCRLMVFFP